MEKYQIQFIEKVCSKLACFNFDYEVRLFIACQFALESFYGLSSLAVKSHNYCGMKTPLVRISTADNAGVVSPKDTFARYAGLDWCVCDFVLCLQYHKPLSDIRSSVQSYQNFIKSWYCPEKDYLFKINLIYNQFKSIHHGN